MKSISSSSLHFGSASPSSAIGRAFHAIVRGPACPSLAVARQSAAIGGVFRYSMTERLLAALPDHRQRIA